jgi:parallel beta-helix repeat protein
MEEIRRIEILLLVCLLLLTPTGSCLTPDTTHDFSLVEHHMTPRRTITVDDDGDGDYPSIKEAVENASSGDTIEVYSGIYYEYGIRLLTPNVTLQGIPQELGNGSGTGKPFINGRGLSYVIDIASEDIVFSGFHIENWGNTYDCALYLDGTHNVVSNNDISNAYLGLIDCGNCSNCSIINNTLSHCDTYPGISLYFLSSYLTISGNVITNVSRGVDLWDSPHNTVTRNAIRNCWRGINILSDHNTVYLNTLEHNTVGLEVTGYDNVIKHNNFIGNTQYDALFIIPPSDWHGPGYIKWIGNYWNRPRIGPHLIFGFSYGLPWFNVDWWPVLKPYKIK